MSKPRVQIHCMSLLLFPVILTITSTAGWISGGSGMAEQGLLVSAEFEFVAMEATDPRSTFGGSQ